MGFDLDIEKCLEECLNLETCCAWYDIHSLMSFIIVGGSNGLKESERESLLEEEEWEGDGERNKEIQIDGVLHYLY